MKIYGEQKSVDHLNITVNQGEIYGFLGRNGAGKTTTIRMLLGLIKPTFGQVEIFGIKEIRSLILYVAKDRNITIFVSSHILSEIEQLATHMGIIHEGRLLEEIAFDKLRERNRNYLEFQVSDDNKAIMLLESQ